MSCSTDLKNDVYTNKTERKKKQNNVYSISNINIKGKR